MSDEKLPQVAQENLEFRDPPQILWIPVQKAAQLLWSENPKLHDIGALVQSIEKYGFQELPRFDIHLPNVSGGEGAIKAGNGRIETLAAMERDSYQLPRGLAQDKNSAAWVMPILAGTDADSLNSARAYAIDSNNLTLSGGDFTAFDISRLWNTDAYVKMLKALGDENEFTISVDAETLDSLLSMENLVPRNLYDSKEDERVNENEQGITIIIPVGMLVPVLTAVKELIEGHPEWKARIK